MKSASYETLLNRPFNLYIYIYQFGDLWFVAATNPLSLNLNFPQKHSVAKYLKMVM